MKYDFPYVPLPVSPDYFDKMVFYGSQLIKNHLPDEYYPVEYSEIVIPVLEKFLYNSSMNAVQLNKDYYIPFSSKDVFCFELGGYQPLQKWLKDRKGKSLTESDIEHYKKMIVAIEETIKIMCEIDEIIEL